MTHKITVPIKYLDFVNDNQLNGTISRITDNEIVLHEAMGAVLNVCHHMIRLRGLDTVRKTAQKGDSMLWLVHPDSPLAVTPNQL